MRSKPLRLPRGWTDALLDDVSQRGSGHTPDKAHPEYWNGGIKWVSLADGPRLDRGYINETSKKISELGIRHSSAVVHPRGTVILLRDADVGRCGILGDDMAVSQHFIAWRCPERGPLSNEFLYYQFQFRRSEFERVANGSTIPTIGLSFFKSFHVWFPARAEQGHIVEILRTSDEAIERTEQLIGAKEKREAKAANFCYAPSMPAFATRRLTTWAECTLGDLFDEVTIVNPGLTSNDVITVGKYAIRRQMEHFRRSVASKDLSSYQLLRPGDFVYDPMSAYYGAIGRYKASRPGIVSPAYRVLHLRPGYNPEYVEGLLRSHYIRFQLEARSSQNNKEGKRRLLQREEFNAISFRLPCPAEQDRIASMISTFSDDVDASRAELHALRRQKRGLMQKLLTGEWRVPLDDSETANTARRATEEIAQ